MTNSLLSLIPADLRIGDIVHAHGMRCLVTHSPVLSRSHPGNDTYWCDTLVLNRDQVSAASVPYAFTKCGAEHRWTIQGNSLARVAVERIGDPCAAGHARRTQPHYG